MGGSRKAFEQTGRTFPGVGGSAMPEGQDTLALPFFVGGWVSENSEREKICVELRSNTCIGLSNSCVFVDSLTIFA